VGHEPLVGQDHGKSYRPTKEDALQQIVEITFWSS